MKLTREQSEALYSDALKYARDREVRLPAEYYGMLPAEARQWAFTVAGISKTGQLQGVLDEVNEALVSGESFQSWKARVSRSTELGRLPDHRIENVFRTNIQSAYNQGRGQQFLANEAVRPFLMYDAINDSRTRQTHDDMDGHIAEVNAAIWATWTPPVGFQCRCRQISLSERQARARGVDTQGPAPNAQADPGWDYDRRPQREPNTWRRGARNALRTVADQAAPELVKVLRGLMASGLVEAIQFSEPEA